MTAGILEHADERIAIGADAGERIVNRRPHTRLRRQMHNAVRLCGAENIPRRIGIRQNLLVECETCVLLQIIEPGAFQRRIVIGL